MKEVFAGITKGISDVISGVIFEEMLGRISEEKFERISEGILGGSFRNSFKVSIEELLVGFLISKGMLIFSSISWMIRTCV